MTDSRLSAGVFVVALAPGLTGVSAMLEGSREAEADAVQACEAELVEEIRIGSLDGAAEYSFSDINSIAVSESGIFAGPSFLPPDVAGVEYGYARISPDGTVLDTLAAPVAPGTSDQSIVIYTRAGDRSPFPEEMLDALSPFGYLVSGFNGAYEFSIQDPAGTIQVKREGFQPVEVKAGERAIATRKPSSGTCRFRSCGPRFSRGPSPRLRGRSLLSTTCSGRTVACSGASGFPLTRKSWRAGFCSSGESLAVTWTSSTWCGGGWSRGSG